MIVSMAYGDCGVQRGSPQLAMFKKKCKLILAGTSYTENESRREQNKLMWWIVEG
jgi:hypothetical protein